MIASRWKFAAVGLLCTTCAATLPQTIVQADEVRRLEREIARLPGVQVGSVSVDPWTGGVVLRDVRGPVGGARVSFGRLAWRGPTLLPQLIGSAHAADGAVTIDNIEFEMNFGKVRIPKVEARGTTLTQADLAAIFDPKSSVPVADRLARLTADEISMPEISIVDESSDMPVDTVINDSLLVRVDKGKVGEFRTGTLTLTARLAKATAEQPKTAALDMTLGKTVTKNFDLVQYARTLTEPRKDPSEPLAPLYDGFDAESFEAKGPGFDVKAATWTGTKAMARRHTVPSASPRRPSHRPGQPPSKEETRQALQQLEDTFDSLDAGSTEMKDVTGDFGGGANTARLQIARIGADFSSGKPVGIVVEGAKFAQATTRIEVGSLALKDLDFSPTFAAMKTLDLDHPDKSPVEPRAFIPSLGQILLTGLDLRVPNRGNTGNADDGASDALKIGKIELNASKYLLGIPTAFSASIEHVVFDVTTRDPSARPIRDMGYRSLDLTSRLDYAWSEAARVLTLKDLSLEGEGMGSIALQVAFGNVAKDLFVGDAAVMQAALLGSSIVEADLRVTNDGLLSKAIEARAKETGTTTDQVKQDLIVAVRAQVAQLFGGTSAGESVADAIAAFINDQKSLQIVAKSARGLTAADLPLVQNPPELMKRLDIHATANR